MPLYELQHVVHRHNGKTALSIEHCQIEAKAVIGLSGPNGSGKSTLLNLLGFIHRPSDGAIFFNGRPTEPFTTGIRNQVCLLPQQGYLLHRTVYRNIAYGLRIRGKGSHIGGKNEDERRRIHDALDMVGLSPRLFAARAWVELSGGEAQRVALAARLVLQPKVLLLDEPTASVDEASSQIIKAAIRHTHRQNGTTLIIASHDELWLEDVCDSMLYLHEGRKIEKGRQTYVYGPWSQKPTGHLFRPLANNQELLFLPPSDDRLHSAAAVDTELMTLHLSKPAVSHGRHSLQGMIQRITLDKRSTRIRVSVIIGDLVFPVLLPTNAPLPSGCYPGQSVWLTYDIADVGWY
jgi:tungstate transport system ATP-binding protein